MPPCSMTGFGQAESTTTSGGYSVELRGVNNRFLEIQLRLPKSLAGLEQEIRKIISNRISRGSILVLVSCSNEAAQARLKWDKALVDAHVRVLREMVKVYDLEGGVTLSDLLHLGDFVRSAPAQFSQERVLRGLRPVLDAALDDLVRSRAKEGAHTATDLGKILQSIKRSLARVEKRAPFRAKKYSAELHRRIARLAGPGIDESRMATEIALMADRMDISEECSRLCAHIQELGGTLALGQPVGKRIGFILQEMNREAGTIGSKAGDAKISHYCIALKEDIEKIREQALNLE